MADAVAQNPVPATPPQEPWYRRALRRAGVLQHRPASPEEVERARLGAEEINRALPAAVSGREAVLRKREQYRRIDQMLEDANK